MNIHSILVPGGYYFLVSRGPPETRIHLFESEDEPEASEVNDDSDENDDQFAGAFQPVDKLDKNKWMNLKCH